MADHYKTNGKLNKNHRKRPAWTHHTTGRHIKGWGSIYSFLTRCPSQRAYARCDGQLAGFAAATARQRADDCGRTFNGDDADNGGLRLSRLLCQHNVVNK